MRPKPAKGRALTLTLYNTLTREKAPFTPLDEHNVRMYVCGPTVYDFAHIGNARPVIVFDVLYRLLKHLYGKDNVTYVRNITDVDDKINARAAEEHPDLPLNEAIGKVTAETEQQFHDDVGALGCVEPDVEPRATEHIEQMKDMITRLIAQAFAYEAEGHVLFEVAKMSDYGKLSGRSVVDMIAGARVEVAPYKKDPMDFVLWKPSSESEPGWASDWGRGRPGWHIECSAMSDQHLKTPFDIHGGGIDLVFPHHENEIAQTSCCFGVDTMAQVWMHNGYLQVEGKKMSKSDGNFLTIRELLEDWPGEVLRLQMLMTHYRQPIDWTVSRLKEARATLDRWYAAIGDETDDSGKTSNDVIVALSDDLNTPEAIRCLHSLYAHIKGPASGFAQIKLKRNLKESANLLGLLQCNETKWRTWRPLEIQIDEIAIDRLIQKRNKARQNKDFVEADEIRDQLAKMGIAIKDGPDGTTWEVAR